MRHQAIQVAALVACAVLVHALWGLGRRAHQNAGMNTTRPTIEEQTEEAFRSVRSIRIASDSPLWVIMHTLLAFGPDFKVRDVGTNRPVRIIDWVCGPGSAEFFQVVNAGSCTNHRTSVVVQGYSECHPDQWLCILSAHSVPLTQRIVVDGKHFTLNDLLAASRQRNGSGCSETAAWTIPAFCRYVPRTARWQNERGEEVTMTSLATDFLQGEDWRTGPCGGTHHLYALASLKAARILRGDAAVRLDQILSEALQLLQRHQNADGTWMSNWQIEKDQPQSVFDAVHITGHHLEWIAVAVSEEQLNQEWLLNAVRGLVTAIHEMDLAEVETMMKTCPEVYGSLCHAVRGLHVIKKRWSCML